MLHPFDIFSCFFTRRVLARLLSTFLCCLTLVVKPWSRFGGPSAFLLLTLKELVFSAQDTLAQHLEATILNITGALFGIGLSTFARYLASLRPDYTASSRVIPAVFLVVIAFLAGWAKSRLPRLQLSARISCFVSIWLLTTNPGISNGSVHAATYFVWITFSAAVICLFSNMLLLRWFSTHFARKIADSLSKLRECLIISLDFLDESSSTSREGDNGFLGVASRQSKLLDDLLSESIQLDSAYSIAAFELRLGRVDVASIKPLIAVVENIRRELSWGCSHMGASPGQGPTRPTMKPAWDLGQAILASMKHVELTLLFVFERNPDALGRPKKETANQILYRLDQARDTARNELAELFHQVNEGSLKTDISSEMSSYSHFFVSLIEMAAEMHNALVVADRILLLHNTSRTRLWYPRLSLAWLGVGAPTVIDDIHVMPHDGDLERFEAEHNMSMAEAREGLSELARWREANSTTSLSRASSFKPAKEKGLLYFRNVIYGPSITRFRLIFAACVRSIARSSHLQHAIKNSIGVALLSLPAFLPTGSSGQSWFARAHGQWMIVSYVWVLETNTGATWRVSYLRITGTILGAVYAYITWLICHANPYGLVVMVTFADLPISWIITKTEVPSLGVVAAVTLPPIVFSDYLDSRANTPIIILTVWRAAMITAGVLAALVMNTFVFPRHCRVLFLRNTSRTLGLLSQLYLTLSRELFKCNRVYTPDDRRRTLRLELEIRDALIRLSRLIIALRDEISLLPKPMMQYRNTISSMQAMLDLMIGVRKIREHIPVREAVSKVVEDRREFVSCVCVSLYACENAFRSRQPLPQFLPSARHARTTLVSHITQSMRHSKRVLGLSHLYGFAEGEVLEDLVDTLERLLSISRTLFGTAEWLTGESAPEVGAHVDSAVRHEWHSVQ